MKSTDSGEQNPGFLTRLIDQLKKRFYGFFIQPLKTSYAKNPIEFIGLSLSLIPLMLLPIWLILLLSWIFFLRDFFPSSTIFTVFLVVLGILVLSMYIGLIIANPRRLRKIQQDSLEDSDIEKEECLTKNSQKNLIPIEIQESLIRFKKDFPNPSKVAFIMMQFGETREHHNIVISIRKTLVDNGLMGLRADDRYYHDDKYYNILTYLHGCGFGIAVFETISDQSFNPNVSLEAGYLLGLNKPICLLKEKKLKTLPSDLVGRLYREFSIEQCDISVKNVLRNWLEDRELVEIIALDENIINYTLKKEDITSIHLKCSDFYDDGWVAETPKQSDSPDSDWQYWDTFSNKERNLKIDSIIHRYGSIDDAKNGFLKNKKEYASRQIDGRLFIPKIGEEAYGYVSSSNVEVATFRILNLLITTCYYTSNNPNSIQEAERLSRIVDQKIRTLINQKHSN